MKMLSLAIALTITTSVTQAEARRSHQVTDPNGNSATATVKSSKTGATARVGAAHAAKFQAYVDDLESGGAEIRFMGGTRRGRCANHSMHPCGRALDVCQLRRGVVDRRCRLPDRSAIAVVAARHGLFEGGQWCHSDYGHAQVGVSAASCGEKTMAARSKRRISRSARAKSDHQATWPQPSAYFPTGQVN